MKFNLPATVAVLRRSPAVVNSLLRGLPECDTRHRRRRRRECVDIVGHLVTGNMPTGCRGHASFWPRARLEPLTRSTAAQRKLSQGKSLDQLLDEFALLRKENLARRRIAIATPRFAATGNASRARHCHFV